MPATPTVEEVLEIMGTSRFGRWGRKLPPDLIRRVLAAKCDEPVHLFLRLAVDDESDTRLARSWERGIQAIVDCSQYDSWGSKSRRARIRALAKNPRLLHAIQGTVAHVEEPWEDMLAALVADGSRESIDALIPHLDPAITAADERLDLVKKLRVHAKRTPTLDALFDEIDRTLDARGSASPALALGPVIGLGAVKPLWFDASISSQELTGGGVPRVQSRVHVDSRDRQWFEVWMSDLGDNRGNSKTTQFDHDSLESDELKVGRCDPPGIPTWLANTATKLGVTWSAPYVSTGLRGAKRDLVGQWLCGGKVPVSPAIAIAESIGLGTCDEVWFKVTIDSQQQLHKRPRAQAVISLDSRTEHYFSACVGWYAADDDWHVTHLGVPETDELRLGEHEAPKLSTWLSRAAKRLKVTWKPPRIESGLRGAKRKQIAVWLRAQ